MKMFGLIPKSLRKIFTGVTHLACNSRFLSENPPSNRMQIPIPHLAALLQRLFQRHGESVMPHYTGAERITRRKVDETVTVVQMPVYLP